MRGYGRAHDSSVDPLRYAPQGRDHAPGYGDRSHPPAPRRRGYGWNYDADVQPAPYGRLPPGGDPGPRWTAVQTRRGAPSGRRPLRRWSGPEGVPAAGIMTENPECVTPEATLTDAARKMRQLDVGIIPVVDDLENRRLQGVITDRDIAVRAVAEGVDGRGTVRDYMTPGVRTVDEEDSVLHVLDLMRSERVRRVPVTDRDGRLVGIIAQADVAVDYAGSDGDRELEVVDTIERISAPARPRR